MSSNYYYADKLRADKTNLGVYSGSLELDFDLHGRSVQGPPSGDATFRQNHMRRCVLCLSLSFRFYFYNIHL